MNKPLQPPPEGRRRTALALVRETWSVNGSVRNKVTWIGQPSGAARLIFVPGWGTSLQSWKYMLHPLATQYEIACFETREKPSAIREGNHRFTCEALADDLRAFLESQDRPFFLAGASLGAVLCIFALHSSGLSPRALSLITPIRHFRPPHFFWLLNLVPQRMIRPLLPAGKWILRHSDYGEDHQAMEHMLDRMSAEEILTVRASIRDLRTMQLPFSMLEALGRKMPVQITGCEERGLHPLGEAKEIADAIPGARWQYFNTIGEVHSRKCGSSLVKWFQQYEQY